MQAVVLAGGKGRRLLPYTTVLPKPLMPIGDYPIIEVVLKQLVRFGFTDIVISTGYLHELISAYLVSRDEFQGKVRFSHENTPLGTIGPLKLIPDLEDSFLVINGDILTDLDFHSFYRYHRKKGGIASIATYSREVNIDFGVLYPNEKDKIEKFIEKPTYKFQVSMGVYLFNRAILDFIPDNSPFGFDDLMYMLIKRGVDVFSYPHEGYWLDIGRPDDYSRAINEFEIKKELFIT